MEFRDTDLRTSLKRNKQLEELGSYSAFKDGTKVFITLPGGKREAFTFKPTGAPFNYILAGYGTAGQSAAMYTPAFVSDKDVTSTLSVKNADATYLKRNGNTSEYDSMNGSAYNSADPTFGGVYVLTTKEGTVYEIDGKTGDLLKVTDTNGNTLSYTDDAIASSTGQKITFERDAQNRITSVKDPIGELIRYSYDAQGDLVSVSDRQGNVTHMEYSAGRSHYLDKIIDPLGRTGVRNEYDDSGRLKKLFDTAGNPVEMVYDPSNSTQTVLDQYGNATLYVYDDRGNVLQERDAVGKQTNRKYDDNNHAIEEAIVITENGQRQEYKTTYSYDAQGNQLSRTNPLYQTDYYTYNTRGQLLSSTDALGQTTSYSFDNRGNVLSKTDATGYTIRYTYDRFGNAETITEGVNDVTQYQYDALGHRTKKIDALGHEIAYTYDANGNQLTESRTVINSNRRSDSGHSQNL